MSKAVEPLISVVMPTYNSEKHVKEAVMSILAQTLSDFEFLIVNEYGSNDATLDILRSFRDPRIRVIQNKKRLGLAESLNEGIRQAKGKYIARMDSDDISVPDRFEKQARFMEQNPETCVLGGWMKLLKTDAPEWIYRSYLSHDFIKAGLLFHYVMCHATIFMRRNEIIKRDLLYNSAFAVEDYELWLRAVEVVRFANINDVLGFHRVWENNRSKKYEARLIGQIQELIARSLSKLSIAYEKDCTLEYMISERSAAQIRARLIKLEDLLKRIIKQNRLNNVYDQNALNVCVNSYWLDQMDIPDQYLTEDARLPLELIIQRILLYADEKASSNNICLYGMGRIGLTALPYFIEYFGGRMLCVSDGDPEKWGREYLGLKCISPEAIPGDTVIFITTGYRLMTEIVPSLTKLGFARVFPYTEIAL